uniref:ribonuclease Z n=1 Tax=Hyaloperonospora arabidopsidis (strain Emoy2) TaxID=559515 RepID=M4B7Q7_HYAAE
MVVHVQVLSVQSIETAPSLLLATESRRFLFNVGEGTQRLCMEHHIRLAKLQNVFLTELRCPTIGGLPGMVLTVSDTGKTGIRVHGPPDLQKYLKATRHFLYRPYFKLEAAEVVPSSSEGDRITPPSSCYEDDEVLVYAVAVAKAQIGAKRKLNETLLPAESDTTNKHVSVSYVVETRTQRGKFLVDRALALGVPKGKLFGQLHQGKDVTLPDGRIVKSIDCVQPSGPAAACVILSCPTTAHVDALVSSHGFHRYRKMADMPCAAVQVGVIFHTGSHEVLHHPKYATWVRSFGDQARHVLLGHSACAQKTVHRASAKLQAQMHAVLPRSFPSNETHELRDAAVCFSRAVPDISSLDLTGTTSGKTAMEDLEPATSKVVLGESMLKFVLAPQARRGFDASDCWPRLDFDQIRESVSSVVDFVAKASLTSETDHLDDDLIDGRITFLGTGCAIPSKYRNVTGMYLELPSGKQEDGTDTVWAGLMLDCGEGSVGQMYRYVGGDEKRLQELVDRLKCVWISHNHADHHLGLLQLLSHRADETSSEPLLVIGPMALGSWLEEYAAVDPVVRGKFSFVESYSFDENDSRSEEVDTHVEASRVRAWLRETLNISQFECVPVKHAMQSYAAVLTFIDGSKLAFSGDCRPSDELAQKAMGAFLIVHEATFEDDLSKEAKDKAHSTIAEAIDVGRRAKARHLVLTHFSQRYPKSAVVSNSCDECDGDEAPMEVLTAVDMLSLRFRELRQPHLVQVCSQLMTPEDEAQVDVESAASLTTQQQKRKEKKAQQSTERTEQ